MAKSKAVWGIDVGHSALKALKLVRESDDKVQLVGHAYIEHAKILSQPDADPPELIAKSLEKFLSRNDITEDHLVVSVPGQHTLARFSKLPPVDTKKIPDIVQFEANQQIPFDMDEVIWDYQTFTEEDSPEIEVGIFAMKRDLIHEHLAHFADVGIEPIVVQPAPLALYDAMRFDGQCSNETTVLVDIGAENTDLLITDKVRIWTRTIPIGGNNFTDALASGFKLPFAKAENLKRQASSSKYARQIFQAMRPVFADLVGEIQRSIGFYTSTHREAKLDRMVGVGNAFKLPGLQKFLQQSLGINVVRPADFKRLAAAPSVSNEYQEQVLSLCVAYGLALQGLELGSMKTNLLPSEIARQVVWRRKKPWFMAAAACLGLAAGVVWMRQSSDLGVLATNRGQAPGSMNYESAAQTFQSGIRDEVPPREYAQRTLAMAEAIQKEHKSLQGEGGPQLTEVEEVVALPRNKDLIPQILMAIHQALPAMHPELAAATSGAEYVRALAAAPDTLARGQREEIFIEALSSEFIDNVYATDYRTEEALREDKPLFDYYSEQPVPGFSVTLQCRTPNINAGQFVANRFVPALQQGQGGGFYFDGVRLMTTGAGARPLARGPAPRGRPGAPVLTTPGAAEKTPTTFDPLTLEDNSGDWHFVVRLVVPLAERPAEKTPGSPQSTSPGRGAAPPRGSSGRGGGR